MNEINITGRTPKEILDMLIVYKEDVEIPLVNFNDVMSLLPINKHHFFAISIKNKRIYIKYSETI